MGITREDINALKAANAVSIHSETVDGEFVGKIRAHLEKWLKNDGVWTVKQQKLFPTQNHGDLLRQIDTTARMKRYAASGSHPHAFHMIHSSRRDEVWQTVVSLLRVGDEIDLLWVANNDNNNNREIGWVRDEVYLVVNRKTKAGVKSMQFMLDAQTGPDNSARMARP
jgi:hypothetical protein